VLARVILNKGCTEVEIVDPGVRRYVGAAAAAKVRQYALEGEREIDPNNPGKIYFHVRGRQPNAVTLYLRAEKFSTLHYSEMGWHSHGVSGQLTVPEHKHDIPAWHTEAPVDDIAPIISEIRAHADTSIWAGVGLLIAGAAKVANPLLIPTPTAIDAVVAGLIASNAASPNEELALTLSPLMLPAVSVTVGDISLEVMPQTNFRNLEDEVLGPRVAMKIIMDEDKQKKLRAHKHDIMAWETEDVDAKTFNLGNIAKTAPTGANGPANPATPTEEEKLYQARPSGAPLTYIRGLQVWIDGDNKTDDILSQLQNAQPTENWTELGDGAGNHVLTMKGTGEIKLDFLPGVTFDEGEHCIELRAPAIPNKSNGGRILYNLYVE
ncbi:MAG TPA: hypothetical protein VLA19_09765, partial [Herpetosiphonaceae bacterium]|nr:hypothetical protein [Herpetosiphonaceae bacterium]